MFKMFWLVFNLFFLSFLGLTDAGQETFQILYHYDASPQILQTMSQPLHPFAVSVSDEDMYGVSASVINAETWLRTHLLSIFPAVNITTIVVGDTDFCHNGQNHYLGMVIPSVKNIYYSLTRWGLEREIKVSAAFSSHCFGSYSALFRDDILEKVTKPLLQFLHSTNSTYSINVPSKITPLSDELKKLASFHTELHKKFGSFVINRVNLIITNPKNQPRLPMNNRKLINIAPGNVKPYPARPIDPFPETSQPPLQSSTGFSVPSSIAKNPHPSAPTFAPPPLGLPFAPEQPPLNAPSISPNGFLPPCNPADTPAPVAGVMQELWCVAKPSVPAETLQEALDYACGDGGANCDEIMPSGNCFYPDTVVAHSSYAFNSYYQKHRRSGGSCSFGGTAMLITSDPSYLSCRFHLS